MAGPTLVIEFAEPVSSTALTEFSALMRGISTHFEQRRNGYFDVNVPVERLGMEVPTAHDAQGVDGQRPFLVYLMGPEVGDESIFEAEHADEPEVEAVLGFRPTHAVNVSAGCNRGIDHAATALLAAAVVDVLGGVVKAELLEGQEAVVAGLPGVLGFTHEEYPMVLGTAEFLRAWVDQPGFRLVK
ncbi:hypothetical protein GFH48_38290 [Streptomyces fagopyri]|uniref:Uncharacterized protein n=1 Tax=Streptomyces fagopyri TaxID=2662397 RepID=A0A5Q0LPD8_9ACTN|nr:DUF6368 family protein [Streptomyces fagopyri]QFZ78366.1 hypothetical protein GFH48_38290 [Streptomyces fagopyri]